MARPIQIRYKLEIKVRGFSLKKVLLRRILWWFFFWLFLALQFVVYRRMRVMIPVDTGRLRRSFHLKWLNANTLSLQYHPSEAYAAVVFSRYPRGRLVPTQKREGLKILNVIARWSLRQAVVSSLGPGR